MIDLYELGKDIGRLILKFRKKKPMEEKYFEPVTARSLAKDFYRNAIAIYHSGVNFDKGMEMLKDIIEPHIRKPSDDDKPLFNLEADIEWLVRGCMRIMHNKKDGDIKAYHELKEFVSQKVSTTGPEADSVPARCEEAYNEAIKLLTIGRLMMPNESNRQMKWDDDVLCFLKKPNPFHEADIVHEDEKEPTLLPFSLEEAKNGAKVVTREMNDVKIVADDLTGNYPLLAVVSTGRVKVSCRYTIGGSTESQHPPMDLFILKEPETIEINIFRNKFDGTYSTSAYETEPIHGEELIKTIKTTI